MYVCFHGPEMVKVAVRYDLRKDNPGDRARKFPSITRKREQQEQRAASSLEDDAAEEAAIRAPPWSTLTFTQHFSLLRALSFMSLSICHPACSAALQSCSS